MCRNEKKYEVEMLQTDKEGNITYANSWDNDSEFFNNYEEALKRAKEVRTDTLKDSWAEVVVNEIDFIDDEAVETSQKNSFKVYGVMNEEEAAYLDTLDNEKIINVVTNIFSSLIDLDVIKKYVSMGFNHLQLEQIFEGLDNDLTVEEVNTYAKPELNEDEMEEIREKLERKLREKRGY